MTVAMRFCEWVAVLSRLESLDRRLQSQRPHALLGTASLHASIINGGRELSSYPDRCSLQIERRTLPGEPVGAGLQEVRGILDRLRRADEDFEGDARLVFSRAAYELEPSHPLPEMLTRRRRVSRVPSAAGRHELLERCGDPERRRRSHGAVRTRRRGSPQRRGIRARSRTCARAAMRWSELARAFLR